MTNDNDGWTPTDIDMEIGKYAGDIEREIRSDTGAALVRKISPAQMTRT